MSRQSKTGQYAYAAGIIDGEGCISIRKVPLKNRIGIYEYSLTVLVNQTDGEAVDFLRGCFGGSIYKTHFDKQRLAVYRWELRGNKASEFLKHIFSFLRIKKAQAELAQRFQLSIIKGADKRHERNQRGTPLTQFEREFRLWCYEEMQKMKAIHHPSRAVVTTECEQSSQEGKRQSELTSNSIEA